MSSTVEPEVTIASILRERDGLRSMLSWEKKKNAELRNKNAWLWHKLNCKTLALHGSCWCRYK